MEATGAAAAGLEAAAVGRLNPEPAGRHSGAVQKVLFQAPGRYQHAGRRCQRRVQYQVQGGPRGNGQRDVQRFEADIGQAERAAALAEFGGRLNTNCPAPSVLLPKNVPFSSTVAPGKRSSASVRTVPVSTCAGAGQDVPWAWREAVPPGRGDWAPAGAVDSHISKSATSYSARTRTA